MWVSVLKRLLASLICFVTHNTLARLRIWDHITGCIGSMRYCAPSSTRLHLPFRQNRRPMVNSIVSPLSAGCRQHWHDMPALVVTVLTVALGVLLQGQQFASAPIARLAPIAGCHRARACVASSE